MTTADTTDITPLRALTVAMVSVAGDGKITVAEFEAAFTAAVREIVEQHEHTQGLVTHLHSGGLPGETLDITHEHHSIVEWKSQAT